MNLIFKSNSNFLTTRTEVGVIVRGSSQASLTSWGEGQSYLMSNEFTLNSCPVGSILPHVQWDQSCPVMFMSKLYHVQLMSSRVFPTGGMGGAPSLAKNLFIPPPGKIPLSRLLPCQIFISPLPKINSPTTK